jgi:predicted RNase H-like nuclease (RuvC/YqgF family)
MVVWLMTRSDDLAKLDEKWRTSATNDLMRVIEIRDSVTAVEKRVEALQKQVDGLNRAFMGLNRQVSIMNEQIPDLESRFAAQQKTVDQLKKGFWPQPK